MPVTARLSKSFYDRFGDDVANELVEWFNAVDATYRVDLREINELNFARFDATMEQRLAQQVAHVDQRLAEQLAHVDRRFAAVDQRLDRIDARFVALELEIDRRFAAFEDKLERRLAEFESRMMGRMFAFWTGQTVGLAALMFAILHSR